MKTQDNWTLVLGIWNFFGIWDLEFEVSLELGSWSLVPPKSATV